MIVEFTKINTEYVNEECSNVLREIIPQIKDIAQSFVNHKDNRSLMVILTPLCRYCTDIMDDVSDYELKNIVLVSPFKDIDTNGYNVAVINKWPPFHIFHIPRGYDETDTLQDFLQEFKEVIKNALK